MNSRNNSEANLVSDSGSGFFRLPSITKKQRTPLFPGIDEETYRMLDNLRDQVEGVGERFILEPIGDFCVDILLVDLSKQCVVFWMNSDSLGKRFLWLLIDDIRMTYYPQSFYKICLEKFDQYPKPPPLTKGLEWDAERGPRGFNLTCNNPRINGEVTYTNVALQYDDTYFKAAKKKASRPQRTDDADGAATMAFKPFELEPK